MTISGHIGTIPKVQASELKMVPKSTTDINISEILNEETWFIGSAYKA